MTLKIEGPLFFGTCGCRLYYGIVGVTSFLQNMLVSLTSEVSPSFSKALNLKLVGHLIK